MSSRHVHKGWKVRQSADCIERCLSILYRCVFVSNMESKNQVRKATVRPSPLTYLMPSRWFPARGQPCLSNYLGTHLQPGIISASMWTWFQQGPLAQWQSVWLRIRRFQVRPLGGSILFLFWYFQQPHWVAIFFLHCSPFPFCPRCIELHVGRLGEGDMNISIRRKPPLASN